MAIVTAGRRGAHRLARRPAHVQLADWLDRPHPQLRKLFERLSTSVSVLALPVAIVVCAITTRGAA